MNILVVNDDGIEAAGIKKLATLAREYGEVTVVAPRSQCSAMSRRITVRGELACEDRTDSFPVQGVRKAYAIDGTPADCVKLGVYYLCPDADVVFSGINYGYNSGSDLYYSGTMGAALEAIARGIPAIAYSAEPYQGKDQPMQHPTEVDEELFQTVNEYLVPVTKDILTRGLTTDAVWNVNFPALETGQCKGVRWDCVPDAGCFYKDHYDEIREENRHVFVAGMFPAADAEAGSDIEALLNGYVSVGLYHPSW